MKVAAASGFVSPQGNRRLPETPTHGTPICLTPVRNEAWILDRFLAAASLWAGRVIVADQGSADGSREAAGRFEKVQVIDNDGAAYDEGGRQRLLIEAARRSAPGSSGGRRVLVALDADEALSANFAKSESWQRAMAAEPGTVLRFRWANVLPGFERCWVPPEPIAFGFVDDGSEHVGGRVHNRRVPWPAGAPVIDLDDVVVLHFQYVVPERMHSKHRWYQAWERLNEPTKRPTQIYRQYHHMLGWPAEQIEPLRPQWLAGYERAGIGFRSLASDGPTWWDREVLGMLIEHGPRRFRKLDVWDVDWADAARRMGVEVNGADLSDPRSRFDKMVHGFLRRTQRRQSNWAVRGVQQLLRPLGW